VFTKTGNTGQIIAGTVGAQSTLENIAMCREAASVGADFALVLPPSYYPSLMTDEAIKEFYKDVSQLSAFDLAYHSLIATRLPMHLLSQLSSTRTPEFVLVSTCHRMS
jgi:dihydrodipicolinate synthase/N-acetylneuraminate lyase